MTDTGPKGKGKGNNLQKQSKWVIYVYGELFKPDRLILFCVDKIRKLEDSGSREDTSFDYSKSLNTMSQEILIKIQLKLDSILTFFLGFKLAKGI